MPELGNGTAGLTRHVPFDKKSGANAAAEIEKRKILFADVGINFFRIGIAGGILQKGDRIFRESILQPVDNILFPHKRQT